MFDPADGFVGGLTEDQIETRVSRAIDRIDAQFMDGRFDQFEYDRRIEYVHQWAETEYRFRNAEAAR